MRLPIRFIIAALALVVSSPSIGEGDDRGGDSAPRSTSSSVSTSSRIYVGSPSRADTVVLKKHVFKDSGARNIPSHTIFFPEHWKVEGGAYWPPPALFRIHPSQFITVSAPDGRQVVIGPTFGAYDYLPSQMARRELGARRPQERTVQAGTPVFYMPQSLEEWGSWIRRQAIQRYYPDATEVRVSRVKVVPPMTRLLKQQLQRIARQQQQMNQLAQQIGDASRQWSDGAVLTVRATYKEGTNPYEQIWVWGYTVLGTDMSVGREMHWSIEPSVSFRAPLGELEEQMPLLMAIANSVRMTPRWAALKADHVAKMQKIDREAFIKRSIHHTQFSREMRDIVGQTGQTLAGAGDRAHERFMQSIHEVSDYELPDGSPITLPIHYNHYFSDGETLVLTNDPNIPAVDGLPMILPATRESE